MRNFQKGWYVLYVSSRMEKRVHKSLLDNQIEAFLPLLKSERQWSDRKKIILEPLFKSYVFVNVNSSKEFYTAQKQSGACTFLSFNNEYVRARNEEIDQIRLLTDCNDVYQIKSETRYFAPGDQCIISSGCLKRLKCEIIRINNERKVLVRLHSIGQSIVATLPLHQLDIVKSQVSSPETSSVL